MSANLQRRLEEADKLASASPEKALDAYKELISVAKDDDKVMEPAIYKTGELLGKLGKAAEVRNLLVELRPYFAVTSKAKTAKIVRTLLEQLAKAPGTEALQVELCKESITWAREEKRTFLRHRLELRLASLLLNRKEYEQALALLASLLREVKRLDDKPLLVEIHLLEAQVHHALRNIPKAKAALTSARTQANAIYCPPALAAQIDMMAGILHSEDGDHKTAFSYFYEAFETNHSLDDHANAAEALKYMLLMKILIGSPDEVTSILTGKLALKYGGRSIDLMRAIAKAQKERSLHAFQDAVKTHNAEITGDLFLKNHLDTLYDTMLEGNLLRLVEPFSTVEIQHIAKLIGLLVGTVEQKLSQMILDKKLTGILDQGTGTLLLFDAAPTYKTYQTGLETIEQMGKAVDALYEKIGLLSH